MEDYLRAADVYIILTRLVAHKVMWRVKEEAANSGKPAAYIRETGVKRILEHAARCIAQQNAPGVTLAKRAFFAVAKHA